MLKQRHKSKRLVLVLGVLAIISLLLAACGDSNTPTTAATTTFTTSATAIATTTVAPTTTQAATTVQPTTTASSTTTTAAMATTAGSMSGSKGGATTSFSLSGLVSTTATYALPDLQAITTTSVTTNPQAGNGSLGEHTYSGPLLYDLLQKAGVKTDATRKNDILRKYVLVTGSDGYSVAIAWGEIDPRFANKKVIVAYQQDGKPLSDKDGFARLIVPGDTAAGRYVSNVAKIEVQDPGDAPTPGTSKPSTTFSLTGLIGNPTDYTLDKLKSLKSTDVTVTGKDAQGNATKTVYSGVLLTTLFSDAGNLKLNASSKNDILRKVIVAVGSDGYSVTIAGGEIDPKFANQQILVAYNQDNQPLSDKYGFARLIVPNDAAQGRFVSNLVKLEVVQAQ